jgi:hypothetical protein
VQVALDTKHHHQQGLAVIQHSMLLPQPVAVAVAMAMTVEILAGQAAALE